MNISYSLPVGLLLYGKSYVYKIERVLGQGTFGITYLARTRVKVYGALGEIETDLRVAVKEFFMKDFNTRSDSTVSCSSGDVYADYKRKFAREAMNLSRMKHPHIVKVLELFERNNTYYYSMEYCGGGSLDELIKKHHKLNVDEAMTYFRQIAGAVSFMHENRMLHLDLKPSNIMLRSIGESVLIDFGLSKQYTASGDPESSTRVGSGTPGYSPLEQANYHEGKDFPVTMDVYALGATLFKMLSGIRPPEASELLNEGFPTYYLQRKGICDELINCISTAMSPIKRSRYQSVNAFLQALPSVPYQESYYDEETEYQAELDVNSDSLPPIPIKEQSSVHTTVQLFASYFDIEDGYVLTGIKIEKNDLNSIPVEAYNIGKYEYMEFSFSGEMARVSMDGKWGYINKKEGKVVTPCKYDYAYEFSEGLAQVKMNAKWGYINKEGKVVIPCKYDYAYEFSEGLASVEMNAKWGYINKEGKVVISCKYDYADGFSEELALVNMNGRCGYINKKGQVVIPCKYDYAENFKDGLAPVAINGRRGYINKEGKVVIPCKYEYVGRFSEGLAEVKIKVKWGYINKEGKIVVPCKYDFVYGFSEGLARVEKNKKWGYINKEGKIVVPCKYDFVYGFSEGLARVEKNEKWGYINKEGKMVVPCKYDFVYDFLEGLAQVKMNGKRGYINKKGDVAIPFQYDTASSFRNNIAIVQQGSNFSAIDTQGISLLDIPCVPDIYGIYDWL